MPHNADALVYLARAAEGLGAPARFLESYDRHPAGCAHDLVVILKGYDERPDEKAKVMEMFGKSAHDYIDIDDSGVDITSYLIAAETLKHDRLCFLNTFSEISADRWLYKLLSHLDDEKVGLVGATASYESLNSSLHLLSKVVWLCAHKQIPYDSGLARQFNWLLETQCKPWLQVTRSRRFRLPWRRFVDYVEHDEGYAEHWQAITLPEAPVGWAADFPVFPNPHLRSNAFAIYRDRLLSYGFPTTMSKMESCAFESGWNSLTMRVRRQGMATLLVGKDGLSYDIADWPKSRTFRLGRQTNILVHDNQTRQFMKHNRDEKLAHVTMSWGDYAGRAGARMGLGVFFHRNDDGLDVDNRARPV